MEVKDTIQSMATMEETISKEDQVMIRCPATKGMMHLVEGKVLTLGVRSDCLVTKSTP